MGITWPARRRRAEREPVFEITAARRGLDADVSARTRRYLLSMGIRTVCFLLAIVTTGWPRWAFLAGALLLPYVSVVLANGGREPTRALPTTLLECDARALPPGPAKATAGDRSAPADSPDPAESPDPADRPGPPGYAA